MSPPLLLFFLFLKFQLKSMDLSLFLEGRLVSRKDHLVNLLRYHYWLEGGVCPMQGWQCHSISRFFLDFVPKLYIFFCDFHVWGSSNNVKFYSAESCWSKKWDNTSLVAKGALAHRLQHRTACKIKNGHQGAAKWPTGSGKRSNPRFLGAPVKFR